ncbi:hypothetical protein ACVTE8_15845, partial [Staphylococcus aureus]
ARQGPMLVTFNGMFDLRIVRQQLRIPIIWHRVWEITFGEHALDENISSLNKACSMRDEQMKDSSKFGGLRPILALMAMISTSETTLASARAIEPTLSRSIRRIQTSCSMRQRT